MKNSQSLKGPKSVAARETTAVLAQFAAAILSSLIASWLAQDILRDNFPLIVIVVFTLLFLFTTILQTSWLRLQLSAYSVFTIMLTVIIVQGILLAWIYVTTRPPTLYLVVDATEQSKPIYNQIIGNIQYATKIQPTIGLVGLRVFGGNLNNEIGCGATAQLTPPIPLKDYEAQLNPLLANLVPQGHASLTIAILRAIKDDLKNTRGPVKLVVITSGLDKQCEPIQSGIFEEMAQDIKTNTRDDINIVIISIGQLNNTDRSVLDQHAKAFNGIHLNIPSADSLSLLLYAPKDYFIDYPNRVTPEPTIPSSP